MCVNINVGILPFFRSKCARTENKAGCAVFLKHPFSAFYTILAASLLLLAWTHPALSKNIRFSVASYNVENLFDLQTEGTEYPEYLPDGRFGWNRAMQKIKLAHTARVIKALDADIVCLQEIESSRVLARLNTTLAAKGAGYPYSAIADNKPTTVKCALLSRFPIIEKKEIAVPGKKSRNILWVTVEIHGYPLMIFINHWKSKKGPESMRIPYATALKRVLSGLPAHCDYILAGDFNENYNEFSTILSKGNLNDTHGITGINQVLGTVESGRIPYRLINEEQLLRASFKPCLYDLWLELPGERRWSTLFFGQKGTPDNILLPKSLYDNQAISYVDNSFDKFDADFLFSCGDIFRWQRSGSGYGRHLGQGYSDHLPVFACFTIGAFKKSLGFSPCDTNVKTTTIAGLYESKTGPVRLKLLKSAVIFKNKNSAVIKQKNGRAVYIYKAASRLHTGWVYDIIVNHLNRHYGNLEINGIEKIIDTGLRINPENYWINIQNLADFSDPLLRNEIIGRCTGTYKKGFLVTSKGHFSLYFSDQKLKPPENTRISIRHARITCHRKAEIIIERPDQIRRLP